MSRGQVMMAKYNDVGSGEKRTLVLEDVPIVNLVSANKSLLVVGAHFIVVPTRLSTAHQPLGASMSG